MPPSGHNELLLGKAIAGRRDKVQLSVKFGGAMVKAGYRGLTCGVANDF